MLTSGQDFCWAGAIAAAKVYPGAAAAAALLGTASVTLPLGKRNRASHPHSIITHTFL